MRIKYYLISFLRRRELEKNLPHFDEIILHILPLLKNGVTPENQTVESVLKDLAEKTSKGTWQLKKEGQLKMFE
ncbi:MAG: hypothetical protein ACKVTZ_09735 [Bacteroidia bacterium]